MANYARVIFVLGALAVGSAQAFAPAVFGGAKLFDKSGAVVPADTLKGTSVALYFGGAWCPMCTNFTPKLKDFYNSNKVCSKTGEQKATIVFISSDFDKNAAMAHFASHGDWLMLDYDSPVRNELKIKYQVWGGAETQALSALNTKSVNRRSGIPGMVVIDAAGHELAFLNTERQGPGALEGWAAKMDALKFA